MSSFSLVISPPDPSQAGFTEKTLPALPLRYLSAFDRAVRIDAIEEDESYVTLRSATMHYVHPKLRLMA